MEAVFDLLKDGLLAMVPGLLVAVWALVEAKAAKSEATWDDWMVARVKDLMREVVKEQSK